MNNISAGGGVASANGGFSSLSGKIPPRGIPPRGTSARKAYDKTIGQGTGVPQSVRDRLLGTYNYPAKPYVSKAVDSLLNPSSPRRSSGGPSGGPSGGSSGGSSGGASPLTSSAKETFSYYEAPIAKKYGFNKTTAYQEALANTAYRREMNDMRKAGLNPSVIYGSHNTSGAYSNIYPETDEPVPSYGNYSGGAGGGYRRRRGRGNSGKYLFSGGAYYGLMAAVGLAASVASHNIGAGMAAAGLAGTAMKALNGFFGK